jgi:nitric oxide reductase subunit B
MEATSPLEHDQHCEESMKRLWMAFVAVMVLSFLVLGWIGTRIYQEMPPLPQQVVTTDGVTLIGTGEISAGQNVWQSMGGMEVGSIWGHGSYVAPDWTADWLHREAVFILDRWSNDRLWQRLRKARQRATGSTDCSPDQTAAHQHLRSIHRHGHGRSHPSEAFESNLAHYTEVFSKGNADYAIPAGAVSDPDLCENCRHSSSGQHGLPRPTVPTTSAPTPTIGPMNH